MDIQDNQRLRISFGAQLQEQVVFHNMLNKVKIASREDSAAQFDTKQVSIVDSDIKTLTQQPSLVTMGSM